MRRVITIAAVFIPVAFLYLIGGFQFLDRGWNDVQFRITSRQATADIVVVEIDPASLRTLDVWPWPRGYYATALENLVDAGARRIAVDIELSSRSHPPEEDEALANVLASNRGKIILPVVQRGGEPSTMFGHGMIEPLPEFRRNSVIASINVRPETDGLVRQYEDWIAADGGTVPSFARALVDDSRPGREAFFIDYSISTRSIPRIPFVDVLTGQFDPETVRGRAVLIGATAIELGDQVAVPVAASLPGPVLQALAYESLISGRALQRIGSLVTLAVALALVIFLWPLYETATWQYGLFVTLGFAVSALLLSVGVQWLQPVIIDISPWVFVLTGMFGYSLVARIDQQAVGLETQNHMIRQTASLMQHVVQNSFDSIVTVGEDGVIETFNRAAEKMFGYGSSNAAGRRLSDLVTSSEPLTRSSLFAKATSAPVEAVACSKAGREFPVELVVTAIDTAEEPKLVAVMRDITERKAHQEQLQHQATHDPLTDLPNRQLLRQRVQEALETALETKQTVAVLLLDLDRFKEINDALGHRTGDLLLKEVARRLHKALTPSDTLARLGGDEFAVLLPATSLEKVLEIGWKCIEGLRKPFSIEGFSLQVDTSLGITLYPDHGHDAETLIQRADVAMYVAKRNRTGLAIYRPDQDFNHMRLLTLRGDLRKAIENDGLHLHFQPKIQAMSNRVMGVEALLRWNHPEHGNIPPDEFIGLAEHSGLIRPLTQWVLENAMRHSAAWRQRGMQLNVSVNLSARNLLEEGLPKNVEKLMAANKVLPEMVTLEITESVIMEDPERALRVVTRLQELGVSISVDDFGTGYSSLAYLMRLPARELKIDKSFVARMAQDPGSATIVHSTIELAHNLGLKVVAEGVETETIWNVLKELGCDYGQGYYFSRPVAADKLPAVVRKLETMNEAPAIEESIDFDFSDPVSPV